MKRFLANLSLMCTLAIGAVSINACTSSGNDPSGELAKPTGLEVSEFTDTGATLNWNAVEGAKTYAVTIGEQSFATDKASYSATGLTPATRYNWSVQAVDGERTSAKVNGSAFTTKASEVAETLIKPTELVTKSKTLEGATLAWKAVENVTGYEVAYWVKGGSEENAETKTSVEPTITLTGLERGTRYEWKVRSTRDAQTSVYSDVATFITEREPVTFNAAVKNGNNGFSNHNGNIFEFLLSVPLFTAAEADRDGFVMIVELIAGGTIDLSTDITVLDIPEGTYNVSTGFEDNVLRVGSGASLLGVMEDGESVEALPIVGGTFTVEGDHTDYTFSLDLILADDDALKAEYRGPLDIMNPDVVDFDFGTLTEVVVNRYGPVNGTNGQPVADAWQVQLYSPTIYLDEDGYHGNGYIINTQLNTPLGTTDRIPDGPYLIINSYDPDTAFGGTHSSVTGANVGTWAYTRENDSLVAEAPFLFGTVTVSTTEGGGYRFEISGIDDEQNLYKIVAESE